WGVAPGAPVEGSAAVGFDGGVLEFTGAMKQRKVVVFVVLAATGVAAALGWIRCPLAALYHIPCPGCGMTRAVLLLSTGHVGASLRMNPFAVPVALASGALALAALDEAPRASGGSGDGARLRASFTALAVTYGAAVALWALRWFGMFGGPVPV
ncbi:MAG: DUF2752 domain-containing protein, partial [Polyangiaceae bacterium]